MSRLTLNTDYGDIEDNRQVTVNNIRGRFIWRFVEEQQKDYIVDEDWTSDKENREIILQK